jgi:hypothetical protein
MKNNYLDKVLNQIVSETIVDNRYSGHEIWVSRNISVPFFHNTISFQSFLPGPLPSPYHIYYSTHLPPIYTLFEQHCRDVYGLNEEEIEYVWNEYRDIIKDKING